MLIDIHAHFYTEHSGRTDWSVLNERRLEAGRKIGITAHIGSILGSWGSRSPTYLPSKDDVERANDRMLDLQREHPRLVYGYCVVNPNYTEHAVAELSRRLDQGMIGIKLLASRRADDELLDPIAQVSAERDVPILHHIWQHRRRDWPGQEASDATELCSLAARHPKARFILAHIGGGGDWSHSLRAAREVPNVWIDLSGSGVDVGMLESAIESVGTSRLVWGTDITMDTGWAKIRYLQTLGLSRDDLDRVEFGNALKLFPKGALDVGD